VALLGTNDLLAVLGLEDDLQLPGFVDGDRVLSRGQLREAVRALARAVGERVPPGSRVGLVDTPDVATSLISILAALTAGRPIALLPVGGLDDPQLRGLAQDADAPVVLHGGAVHPSGIPWQGAWAARQTPVEPVARAEDEALILYTSGTTQKPRGVRISRRNVATNLSAMMRLAAAWGPADRVGQVLPLTHSFGLSMALLAIARRAPIVTLGNGPPAPGLGHALDEHEISVFACVPYYLRLMSRQGLSLGASCGHRLQALYLAGGGISDADLATTIPDYRGTTFLMYGFTEATARVAVRRVGDGAPADSVGLPLPGTHLDVVGADGRVLPAGEEGFIRVSSPSLMLGYLGERDREPGVPIVTTDLGRTDECGNVYVTGRAVEMLNFHGHRVSIPAVEYAVSHIPGVLEARLVPDSRQEDAQCVLLVVPRSGVDQDGLRAEIAGRVRPRHLVRGIAFVEHLEKTRSGKPVRRVPSDDGPREVVTGDRARRMVGART
jgi:acyl-coenzyme A synthetase/AMP-(fatty) acid ligase